MNKGMRAGKASELAVASGLIRYGLDVYLPAVDDQAIDLLVRVEDEFGVRHFDVQVKSVKGFNRILGVKNLSAKSENYLLILHFRHEGHPDDYFFLTRDEAAHHHLPDSNWGDLVFNKEQRERYAHRDLRILAEWLKSGEPTPP